MKVAILIASTLWAQEGQTLSVVQMVHSEDEDVHSLGVTAPDRNHNGEESTFLFPQINATKSDQNLNLGSFRLQAKTPWKTQKLTF